VCPPDRLSNPAGRRVRSGAAETPDVSAALIKVGWYRFTVGLRIALVLARVFFKVVALGIGLPFFGEKLVTGDFRS